jgi:hypothetical protein
VIVHGSAIGASFSARVTLPAARDDQPGKNARQSSVRRHFAPVEFVLALIARGKRYAM